MPKNRLNPVFELISRAPSWIDYPIRFGWNHGLSTCTDRVWNLFLCIHVFKCQTNCDCELSVFFPLGHSDSAPSGQAVSDQFSLGWDSVLVGLHDVIVARLDGRGSGFEGQKILHAVHQRVGTVDVRDQLAALQWDLYIVMLLYTEEAFCASSTSA